ncbi:MAG: hypothetical protein QM758_19510 [Armatimonas sp.]
MTESLVDEPQDTPLPATVKALGWVSFFTDLSSELLYPINPTFLRSLGAPPEAIGLIEGSAEATASLLQLGSGRSPTACHGASRLSSGGMDWLLSPNLCWVWLFPGPWYWAPGY